MIKDFKAFIARGNVLDLAVAVVIGAAFGAVVSSFVADILMPPIGLLLGKVDFKDLFVSLNGQAYPSLVAAKTAGAPVLAYGNFLNTIVNFIIIAFAIFLIVRQAERMKKPAAAAAATTKDCPYCTMAIPLGAKKCPQCTAAL